MPASLAYDGLAFEDAAFREGHAINCCGKMPSLREASLPGSCNLAELLGMSCFHFPDP